MGYLDAGINPDSDYLYDAQARDEDRPVCACCGRTVEKKWYVIRDVVICDICMDDLEEWREISYA